MSAFRDRTGWYFGISAYWFATSAKWFILLQVVLPGQVERLAPEGEKNTAWGMVFALGAVWAMIGPSLFGHLSDRLGRRKPFLAFGAAATVIALMTLWQAPSLAVLAAGYLLLQISDDVGTGPYGAIIPQMVPVERRGRASGAMGLMTLSGQLAVGIFAFLVGGDVASIYIGLASVNLLAAAWTIVCLRGETPAPAAAEGRFWSTFVRGWLAPWKSRDFFWVWFTRFLHALGFYLVQPYLRYYLDDVVKDFSVFGLFRLADAGMATNLLALTISLFGAAGSIYASRAADRLGRKRTIYLAGSLMAAVLVPFALIQDFGVIWTMACLFGVGYGMYLSADWALVSDVLPDSGALGKDMGVWQMSNSSVQIVAGSAGRAVDGLNAVSFGMGYQAVFLAASVAFLVSTVLVRKVRGSR